MMASFIDKLKSLFSGGTSTPKSATAGSAPGQSKTGKITYFNWSKGYGFVECEDIEGRIFLHRTKLRRRVKVGDDVHFSLGQNKRGYFVQEVF